MTQESRMIIHSAWPAGALNGSSSQPLETQDHHPSSSVSKSSRSKPWSLAAYKREVIPQGKCRIIYSTAPRRPITPRRLLRLTDQRLIIETPTERVLRIVSRRDAPISTCRSSSNHLPYQPPSRSRSRRPAQSTRLRPRTGKVKLSVGGSGRASTRVCGPPARRGP